METIGLFSGGLLFSVLCLLPEVKAEKLFELASLRVIGVDSNIQFSRLIIKSLLIFSTSEYDTMQF